MYSQPGLLLVPIFIAAFTFAAGLQMEKATSKKKAHQIYLLSIVANVGILIFFKYTNFFTNSATSLVNFFNQKIFHTSTVVNNSLLIQVIAPLGISYITFQTIGYLVEIKRGNSAAEKNFGHFATFLLFFPKLVSGPVERSHHLLPQLKQPTPFSYENISIGSKQIIWGLFKKLVIADRLAIFVNLVFENTTHHSGITLLVACIFYTFQMYADFSGYTDMALGFAKILGIDLLPNFNRPFFAKSVTEFWRKWHISLSTWFADYFYNPIAIAKRDWGNWAIVYAFMVTFVTLGFWHGANWTFIVFGLLQAIMLPIEFFTKKARKQCRKKIPAFLNNTAGILFTFFFFMLSLIFFRAGSLAEASQIIKGFFSQKGGLFVQDASVLLFSVIGIFLLLLLEFKKEFYSDLFTVSTSKFWLVRNGYYCFLLLAILLAGVFDGGQFIYKQF